MMTPAANDSSLSSHYGSLRSHLGENDNGIAYERVLCYNWCMKENKLLDLAQDFAVDIIVVARILQEKGERGFADQIKRSGTSISANISEGNHPQSRADMISKFEIALKEANETENWLTVFKKSALIDEGTFSSIYKKLVKIKIVLIHSIKTLKGLS